MSAIPVLRRFLRTRTSATLLLILPFGICTALGLIGLQKFDGTAGPQYPAPPDWPASSSLRHEPGRMNLLVFAHPLCPCTRATLDELAFPLSTRVEPMSIRVLVVRPAHDSSWSAAEIRSRIAALPGATAIWDEDGIEARRFKARVSGFVLLYDATGRLLFQGGVTGSRGHVGGNYGIQSFTAALKSHLPSPRRPPVFGCSLAIATSQEAQRQ